MTNVTINTKNVNYEVPVEQVMHKITYSSTHSLLNDQTRVIFWTDAAMLLCQPNQSIIIRSIY